MPRLPRRPWKVFQFGTDGLAIFDADGNELIHWKGFDSSAVRGEAAKAAMAYHIVACVNAYADKELPHA
jgi:hypothetical protein